MVVADRGTGNDAGLGRAHGSIFLAASHAGSALWIQGRGWRGGVGAADGLSAADRPERSARGSAHERPRGGPMNDSRPRLLPTSAELAVATPEGVVFRLPLAGPASRLYAMLL